MGSTSYGSIDNLTIGVLGLTYKAGTSTLRRSPALDVIRDLLEKGVNVKAYDPGASLTEIQVQQQLLNFELSAGPYETANNSDALVITTDWPEFTRIDYTQIKSMMKRPVLIDTKNMLDGEQLHQLGFLYSGIGRGYK